MATGCPINFDVAYLREQVRATYHQVARNPDGDFHFHRGPDYAHRFLGYDAEELAKLPALSTARFAGVGNPLAIGPIEAGATVLDHACGAGMDLLLAARRVGPRGRLIGIDMTSAMVDCATQAAREAGFSQIAAFQQGYYEDLPVADASVDVVISNGVLNLSPEKHRVMREVFRVLKPGGRLYLADVVVQQELTMEARSNPDLWAACVGGALVEPELEELAREAGFVDGRITKRFNCFYGTSAESKVARHLFVQSLNFGAWKS